MLAADSPPLLSPGVLPPLSVLIIDDQASMVQVLRRAVSTLAQVYCAMDGSTALERVRTLRPDLVLLDIEMPKMDGYAVFAAMRDDPDLRQIPVIFVTGHERALHELHVLELGGVDFLQKPLDLPLARVRIRTQLELRQRTRQLDQARADLEAVVFNVPAFIAQWDDSWNNVFCSDVKGRWFGVEAAKMRGMHMRDIVGAHNFGLLAGDVATSGPVQFYAELYDAKLSPVYCQVALVPRRPLEGDRGVLMLITDVTARRQAENALYEEKEKIRTTLNSIGDAVIATDADGKITFCNPIAELMTGWMAAEAIGQPIERVMPLTVGTVNHDVINPVRVALAEARVVGMALDCHLTRRDGRRFAVEDSAAPIFTRAGRLSGAIMVFHDVSEARAMALKMTHLANHDALTNLPNRLLLRDRVVQALSQAARHNGRTGLLIVGLDEFRNVNDTLGYAVGDGVLREVASRMHTALRAGDTLSRHGGDEFVLLMPDAGAIDNITACAARLAAALRSPFLIGNEQVQLAACIGIAVSPDDSVDAETLYRHAESALHLAKRAGAGQTRFFAADIEEQRWARHRLQQQIRHAVEHKQFEVYYQAKVDGVSNRVTGVEALLRWYRPGAESIGPSAFIPVVEELGLINTLGSFVLQRACEQACRWHRLGHHISIAVNVSALQLAAPDFFANVCNIVGAARIEPAMLQLEITEGVLVHDVLGASAVLRQLRAIGVKLALDDFGTGYSNLAYLRRFPIDVVKVDQSFVRDMQRDVGDAAIIDAIIHIAAALNLEVVAEGVETAEQADLLRAAGCNTMQGYFFGKPVPADAMSAMLGTP